MDKQTAFDKAYLGVMQQGGASMRVTAKGTTQCAYRDPKGRKCAAGHLIPDELYNPEDEGLDFLSLCGLRPEVAQLADSREVADLVGELQRCHDNAAASFGNRDTIFLGEFALTAGYLARSHGLKIPKLNTTG